MDIPTRKEVILMILLRSSRFQMISLPDSDWSIYTNNYYADDQGRIYREFTRGDLLRKGDLVIETPNMRYVFCDVDDCFTIARQLLDQIENQAHQRYGHIDMETLGDLMGFMSTKLEIHNKVFPGSPVIVLHPEL